MSTPPPSIREYDVYAQTTATFGRVLCNARNHHFIIDGPVQNGCPGEELTPPELFLTAVASCGAELVAVIAREESVAIGDVSIHAHGVVDRSRQPHEHVTVFNSVRLTCRVTGVERARAKALLESFQRRCPIFGTIKVAVADVVVELE